MTTAILDYGSGNLRSAAKAFERAAAEHGGDAVCVTSRPEEVAAAERIVLPGVGAFADCRRGLAAVPGLEEAMREAVLDRGRPPPDSTPRWVTASWCSAYTWPSSVGNTRGVQLSRPARGW